MKTTRLLPVLTRLFTKRLASALALLAATLFLVACDQSATDITATTAVLNAYLDDPNLTDSVYFEYGTDTNYGSTTPGVDPFNAVAAIGTLSPNTVYHYRFVAYSSALAYYEGDGTVYGADATFTTGRDGSVVEVQHPAGAPLQPGASTIFLGKVKATTSGAPDPVVIRSIGTLALNVTGISVTGSNDTEFSVNSTGALGSIDVLDQRTFTVTFNPGIGAGVRTATLHVASNDTLIPSFDVGLTGVATTNLLVHNGPSVNTPDVFDVAADGVRFSAIASSTTTRSFTLENTGAVPITVSNISVPNGFTHGSIPVAPIAPGGSATFTVSLNAPNAGSYDGPVTITSNDPLGSEVTFTVLGTVFNAPSLATTSGTTSYQPAQSAVAVDSGLTVTATGEMTAAQVSITNGFQTNDTLSFTPLSGIGGSYDASRGVLTFAGAASAADYQTVLRSVKFSNPNLSATGARTITFSVNSGLFNPATGHFYEFVNAPGISWTDSFAAAPNRSLYGMPGYLVTITSDAENTFVSSRLQGLGWLGASDAGADKVWSWRNGPEAGEVFFYQSGYVPGGSNNPGVGPAAIQPPGDHYSHWSPGEPNDYSDGFAGSEDYGHFYTDGTWNDFPNSNGVAGYVVEYGGQPGDPDFSTVTGLAADKIVLVASVQAPTVTTSDATLVTTTGATLNGSVSSNGADTMAYFSYSTDPSLATGVVTTTGTTVTSGTAAVNIARGVTPLSAHTTYYFKATGSNSAGLTSGTTLSFTTANTAPVAVSGTTTATAGVQKTITLDFSTTDADGDAVSLTAASGANLTVNTFSGNQVTFTPSASFSGTTTLNYTISDGTGTVNATANGSMTVLVAPAVSAPVVTTIAPLNVTAHDALLRASVNPNGVATTVEFFLNGGSRGTVSAGSGSSATTVSLDPGTLAGHTTYTVTTKATSAGGAVNGNEPAAVTFTTPNSKPVAVDDRVAISTSSTAAVTVSVLVNDSDSDNDAISITSITQGTLGKVKIVGTTLQYTPSQSFENSGKTDTFTYTIRDNFGGTDTASVSVSNPFFGLKGTYAGPLSGDAGYISLTVTAQGAFTGKLRVGTETFTVTGTFDSNGVAKLVISRPNAAPLIANLEIDPSGLLTGDVGGVPFNAERVVWDEVTNPAPQAGTYTVLMPNDPSLGYVVPQGHGYATMTISKGGSVSMTGRLGDDTPFSDSVFLNASGQFPIYVIIPYSKPGKIAGLITVRNVAGISDCDGTLTWTKPLDKSAPSYNTGFSFDLILIGSRYTAPAINTRVIKLANTNGSTALRLGAGNLPSQINKTVTISTSNVVAVVGANPESFAMTITPASGLLSGSFVSTPPGEKTATKKSFTGVFFQKQNLGSGVFLDTGVPSSKILPRSGYVTLPAK